MTLWMKWLSIGVLSLLYASTVVSAQQQQQHIIDPIRNALGFWSRLLNRMAQPRLPTDNELRFTIDDFDLETFKKLLEKETDGKVGGKLFGPDKKFPKQSFGTSKPQTTPKPTPTVPAWKQIKQNKPDITGIKHKKNSTSQTKNIETGISENPTAHALLKLAKQELEEVKLEEKKEKRTKSVLDIPLNVTATTAKTITTEATTTKTKEETTTNGITAATGETPSALEDAKTLSAALSDEKAIVENESEENLYFEKELRARMKHFEEVENALLSELGSGEEPIEEPKPIDSLKMAENGKVGYDEKSSALANSFSEDKIEKKNEKLSLETNEKPAEIDRDQKMAKQDRNEEGSEVETVKPEVNISTIQDSKSAQMNGSNKFIETERKSLQLPKSEKSLDEKQAEIITAKDAKAEIKLNSGKSENLEKKVLVEVKKEADSKKQGSLVAFVQSIPDAEEEDEFAHEDVNKNIIDGISTTTTTLSTTETLGLTTSKTSPSTSTTSQPPVTTTMTTAFPVTTTNETSNEDAKRGLKQNKFTAIEAIDEQAAMKPVEKIVDGIGPLILPLLGYGHDAARKYYPYLQHGIQHNFVRPDAFVDSKTLPEDIVGMGAAIATELARSYVADQVANIANVHQAPTAAAAARSVASSAFSGGSALQSALGATTSLRPVVASAGRTVNGFDPNYTWTSSDAAISTLSPYERYLLYQAQQLQSTTSSTTPFIWPNKASSSSLADSIPRVLVNQRVSDIRHAQPLTSQAASQTSQGLYSPSQTMFAPPSKVSTQEETRFPYGVKQKSLQQSLTTQNTRNALNSLPFYRRYVPNPSQYRPKVVIPHRFQSSATAPTAVSPYSPEASIKYASIAQNPINQVYSVNSPYGLSQLQTPIVVSEGPLPLLNPTQTGLLSPQLAEKIAASVAAALPGYRDIYGIDTHTRTEVAPQENKDSAFDLPHKQTPFLGDSGIIASSSSSKKFPSGFPDSFMKLEGNSISVFGGDGDKTVKL